MVDKELGLKEVAKICSRNKKFIIYFTLSLVILTLIVTLAWPKTYKSVSEIRLAQLIPAGDITSQTTQDIFSVIESKSILESSSVIQPAIDKYCPKIRYENFINENINIRIISERIGKDEKAVNYLEITVYSKDAKTASELNKEIITNFFNYTMPYYSARLSVLEDDLAEANNNINQLETTIKKTQDEISSLRNSQLSSEGLSKSTLLSQILSQYQTVLIDEQDKRTDTENRINTKKEYAIISAPQIQNKPVSPNLLVNLIISTVAGIIISLVYLLVKEE
jgi:uncharacterized protein involved in exopolysaccharide biosynthesis